MFEENVTKSFKKTLLYIAIARNNRPQMTTTTLQSHRRL
jgi:hypothetical protein